MKLAFSRQIFEKKKHKYQISKNPSSGIRVVSCGRTDGHDEANSPFSQFCNVPRRSVMKSQVPLTETACFVDSMHHQKIRRIGVSLLMWKHHSVSTEVKRSKQTAIFWTESADKWIPFPFKFVRKCFCNHFTWLHEWIITRKKRRHWNLFSR